MIERVRVELTGRRAAGRSMVMDLADWEMVSREHGERWTVTRPNYPGASVYVISRRQKAREADYANTNNVYLGRILIRPPHRHHVVYRDGNSLNLTRANLTTALPTRFMRNEPPVRVEHFRGEEGARHAAA